MSEYRQARALFDAFLARFFENEISNNSRDMKGSFLRMVGMLAAPGLLLPISNLFKWSMLAGTDEGALRRALIGDKTLYITMSMGAMMLLTAVVWQALLVDRRDAIVLGSFPVRVRAIVGAKIAALFAYLGIVAGGMHVVASLMYGMALSQSPFGMLRAIPAHFIASTLACLFACLAVAAFQAVVLAVGGSRVLGKLTAPAQLLLAAAGLLLFLLSPLVAATAVDYAAGNARSAWAVWLPPVWFVGLYEVIVGEAPRVMPAMALRALAGVAAVVAILVAAYPIAYRRVARAAIAGSPLGGRRSMGAFLLRAIMGLLPLRTDTRGAAHFILLTLGRVARQKLIVASALGAALAMCLPFILKWASHTGVLAVPGRSHIAVPFVFVMFGIAGVRMAYNLPVDHAASWIFSTAVRPSRIGATAARTATWLLGIATPVAICLPIYAWFWSPAVAVSLTLTLAAFGACIAELSLHSVDFVPFTRGYSPERGKLQSRWPFYFAALIVCLQLLPAIVRALLVAGHYWPAPAFLAAVAFGFHYSHPPEPPELIDADLEDKPLALRLY